MVSRVLKIFHLIVFCITAAAGLLFAALYLFRPEFMPYHQAAVGKQWQDIEPEIQLLILALMRVSGGGFLAASLSVFLLLLFPFRRDILWARIAIPVIGLACLVPTLAATLMIKFQTPATPPYILVTILVGLLILSLILTFISIKN